jgi:hypothetical protein
VNPLRWNQRRRRQFNSSASMLCAAIVSLALLAQTDVVSAQAQDADSIARAQALAFAIDSTDEGPHIYWQDNSSAIVIYLCDGEVLSSRGTAADSLRFSGLCKDSTTRYSIPASPPAVEPHVFEDVSRVFTVSDLHGEYEALVELFRNAGVIDDDLRWDWGDGHLVVLGDVFDRGDKVTECLWLIHRLEREAKLDGGRVHYLLGNHEKMVIRGDLRYVHEKYMSGIARRTRITYDDMFGSDMELGRWLRSKHVAVKLNDVLFVHGGLPPEVVERELSLDDMNAAARSSLDLKSYELVFSDLPWFLFSSGGPLWYRGYHGPRSAYPATTSEELDMILEYYGVKAVVVGHSEISEVTSLHQGRVYGVDVPVEKLGGLQGLLWKDGEFYRVLSSAELELLSGQ